MTKAFVPDEFLTTKEVAAEYGLPEGTLRYYRQIGSGPACFKLGGRRVIYRRSAVDRWVAAQEASSSRGGVQ
jgi:prophage regulatory protein